MVNKVLFIATGGTISTEMDHELQGYVSKRSGEDLISDQVFKDLQIEIVNFRNINSPYITPVDMLELGNLLRDNLQRNDVIGAVVTHGTSTLEETAAFLDVLSISGKPIVLTGSQRPASAEWPDGPANLSAAFRTAFDPAAVNQGVLVVFADKIYAGREVNKIHTTAMEAFAGGQVGYVYPDRVILKGTRSKRYCLRWPAAELPLIDIIPFYSGADGKYFRAAIDSGISGIIVEGLGMGNVNKDYYNGIKTARESGLTVVLTSRCAYGRVLPYYGYCGGGASLKNLGVIFGGSFSSAKARIFLMIGLASGYGEEELQGVFDSL